MNILSIDTSDNKKTVATLVTEEKTIIEEAEHAAQKAEITLELIEKLLKNAGISKKEINEIRVKKTGTSYTGLRVGTSIANALSFALLVPNNEKEIGSIEVPQY